MYVGMYKKNIYQKNYRDALLCVRVITYSRNKCAISLYSLECKIKQKKLIKKTHQILSSSSEYSSVAGVLKIHINIFLTKQIATTDFFCTDIVSKHNVLYL